MMGILYPHFRRNSRLNMSKFVFSRLFEKYMKHINRTPRDFWSHMDSHFSVTIIENRADRSILKII